MTTVYCSATSVDGFIADAENSLSWLLSRDVDPSGPLGYEGFIANVGALAMGSTTYRWVVDHEMGGDPSRPWLYDIPTWVFTTRPLPAAQGDVRFVRGPVGPPYADMLAAAGGRDVWVVGGGDLAGQFADAGLLDELWVQYAPVTLGTGAPLLPRHLELRLEDVVRNGVSPAPATGCCADRGQQRAGRVDGVPPALTRPRPGASHRAWRFVIGTGGRTTPLPARPATVAARTGPAWALTGRANSTGMEPCPSR